MRRLLSCLPLALAGVVAAACSNTPSQPSSAQQTVSAASAKVSPTGNGATTGKPQTDPTWADGQTVYMLGARLIVDAIDTQPNLYASSEELYMVVFPQPGPPPVEGLAGPITLPSGYQPQCNPCFHPGLPAPFVYHDHVITGAPGMGKNGTAGQFKGPWKVILLMYDPAYANSPNFKPVTSETALDAAEAAGGIFLEVAPGAANPYEIVTGNVLICPIVSPKA